MTPQQVMGYVRVSTDEQTLSVEAQREALSGWCQAQHATLVDVYVDVGISGGAPLEKRPGLLAALSALTKGTALLVLRRDRLAQDTLTAAIAERVAQKAGAAILTVTGVSDGEGPEAQLMRTMIDAFVQYERALITVRTKTAMQRRRAKGERIGAIPYGQQLAPDRVHVVDAPSEQAVIVIVQRLRADGLSSRAIAAELNQRGLTNRAGGRFMATQVVHILQAVA
jgi:DNA invertase Pin-like site-specific DNA recombinase